MTKSTFLHRNNSGMTLVEISVAMGMVSILILALAEMTYFSARATRSEDAVGELNNILNSVITAVNINQPYEGNFNSSAYNSLGGCNQIFYKMTDNGGAPISVIYTNYQRGNQSPALLRVTGTYTPNPLPSSNPASVASSLPWSNMAITAISLTEVDGPLGSRFDTINNQTAYSYLYSLNIQAQKTSINKMVQVGGNTVYNKSILVQLWKEGSTFMGCS